MGRRISGRAPGGYTGPSPRPTRRCTMSIKQTIADDLKAAMRSQLKDRLEVLRMARARMQEAEVALRAEYGRDYEISDEESIKVLSAYAKQRRDSIDAFRKGGREDLAAQEEKELAI